MKRLEGFGTVEPQIGEWLSWAGEAGHGTGQVSKIENGTVSVMTSGGERLVPLLGTIWAHDNQAQVRKRKQTINIPVQKWAEVERRLSMAQTCPEEDRIVDPKAGLKKIAATMHAFLRKGYSVSELSILLTAELGFSVTEAEIKNAIKELLKNDAASSNGKSPQKKQDPLPQNEELTKQP
jgi:hypothetical protein